MVCTKKPPHISLLVLIIGNQRTRDLVLPPLSAHIYKTRSTPEEYLAQPTMLLAFCALTIVSLARPSQESPASETTLTMHLSEPASKNSAEGFAL